MAKLPYKNVQYGKQDMDKDGLEFLYQRIAESLCRTMGCACDENSNAVINSLKKGLQVEKIEMVALLANRNDGT